MTAADGGRVTARCSAASARSSCASCRSLVVIAVAVLIFGPLIDNYLGGSFFNRIASSVAITAILAVGQTLVVLTRNIDLSVGSIVGITAYFIGRVPADHPDSHRCSLSPRDRASAAASGSLNGVLVA